MQLTPLTLLLAAALSQSACATPADTPPQPKTWFSLGLIAYNYTDRYIDTYSVNGAGGGQCLCQQRPCRGRGHYLLYPVRNP
ncbi:hypothetical protein HNQ50_000097 [Silvimonas terrae]|uniref:Uncharacterized protein n=1 Tax=Silvimonas terrae TaxID=300266 RepID=A0A840R915_9NEIS|nr:hypothetical protein [Silvimonas terrae]MBB5189387.1 hypothetical protein [Silvimonas terrae]